jgi:hypothetical protein
MLIKKMDLIDSVKALKITDNLSANIEEQTLIDDTNYLKGDVLASDSDHFTENKDIDQKPEKSTYPV